VAKLALPLLGKSYASRRVTNACIWCLSTVVFAWPLSVSFLHIPCCSHVTYLSPTLFFLLFLSFHPFLLQLYGLYIVNVDRSPSIDLAKVVLVRPYVEPTPGSYYAIPCVELTDRRVYFAWEDARRRDDVPLYKDGGNALEPSLYGAPSVDEPSHETWPWLQFGGWFASLVL
jgi:hypothetical protein